MAVEAWSIDNSHVDEEALEPHREVARQNRCCQLARIISLIIAPFFALICYASLILTLYFAFEQLRGRWGILMSAVLSLSFILVVLGFGLILRSKVSPSLIFQDCLKVDLKLFFCTRRSVCSYTLIFCVLLLTELCLMIIMPVQSIFPFGISDAFGETCPFCSSELRPKWLEAQAFLASSGIDFARVQVLVGGASANLKAVAPHAMVFENTIYLSAVCKTSVVLVHELVHIWQFQTGWFGVRTGWETILNRIFHSGKYDYGGEAGLQQVLDRNPRAKITDEFGNEQQAMIVQHYFVYSKLSSMLEEPHAAWIKYRLQEMKKGLSPGVLRVLRQAAGLNYCDEKMRFLISDVLRGSYLILLKTFALQILQVSYNFSETLGNVTSRAWIDSREETEYFKRVPVLHLGPARLRAGEALRNAFARFSNPPDELNGWSQSKQELGGCEGDVTRVFMDKTVSMSFRINGTELIYKFPNEAIEATLTADTSVL